jgi:hypothetical protein
MLKLTQVHSDPKWDGRTILLAPVEGMLIGEAAKRSPEDLPEERRPPEERCGAVIELPFTGGNGQIVYCVRETLAEIHEQLARLSASAMLPVNDAAD